MMSEQEMTDRLREAKIALDGAMSRYIDRRDLGNESIDWNLVQDMLGVVDILNNYKAEEA
jgi:hypothetical protein